MAGRRDETKPGEVKEYSAVDYQTIREHCQKYAVSDDLAGLQVCLITAASIFVSMAAYPVCTMLFWGSFLYSPMIAACVVLRGIVLVRSFHLNHDCLHDLPFTNKTWNYWAGKLAAGFTLCDYETWRRAHLQHHVVLGKRDATQDDPNSTIFWTTEDWATFPWYKKAVLRIARDPIVYFTIMPIIVWMLAGIQHGNIPDLVRPNWVPPKEKKIKSGAAFAFIFAFSEGILGTLMFGPGYTLYLCAGGWFAAVTGFLISHWNHYVTGVVYYGVPHGVYHREMAAILGSTIIAFPHWLHDFWLGIGYHHIHHLNSRVPCYKLRQCYEEADPQLWRCIPYVGLRRALLSLLLVQYNPVTGRHESFPMYQWILNMFDEEALVVSNLEAEKNVRKEAVAEQEEAKAGTPKTTTTRRITNDAELKFAKYSALRAEFIKASSSSWKADLANSGNKGLHGIGMSQQIGVPAF